MTNPHKTTIKTYDSSAKELAAYFQGIGPRVEDIELGLKLAGNPGKPRVVEIGCGDGRDAAEIVKRAGFYQGFDPSAGLLALARENVADADFVLADALSYEYPAHTDAIFAFASLLHVSKEDFAKVCKKVAASLRQEGIFFISLKERDTYEEEIKRDAYGERMFCYYNPELVEALAGEAFQPVYEDHQVIGKTKWLTIALRKT